MFFDAVCFCTLYEHASGQDTVASYSKFELFAPLVVQGLGDYLLAPGKTKSALSVSKNKKWLSLEQGSPLNLIGQLWHENADGFCSTSSQKAHHGSQSSRPGSWNRARFGGVSSHDGQNTALAAEQLMCRFRGETRNRLRTSRRPLVGPSLAPAVREDAHGYCAKTSEISCRGASVRLRALASNGATREILSSSSLGDA